ncbi:hypothetical protein C7382_12122 [Porphyromonas loveana]|uniref:Uncharacterized protein n=1 Tax=Porphyromonas loveana TaxID=1884669 RepID=A0A2U1F3Q1_9PORP|nr:hypothetical protein C7382_12122 [Porphyromonas loveana]
MLCFFFVGDILIYALGQVGDDFLSQLAHYIKGVLGLSQGSYR